jgi:PEGA domain
MRPVMTRPHALLAIGLAIGLLGCVERSLTIRSEPTGATVILNGRRLVQRTPVTIPITHHGVMRVEAEMDWHFRAIRSVETNEPWYDAFPFDLFAELWPGTLTSKTDVLIRLKKLPEEGVPPGDLNRLLEEAEAERKRLTKDD